MMFKRNYCIKDGYKIREHNAPFLDIQPTGTVYQPHVYELAKYIADRAGIKHIIDIGAGNGEKLQSFTDVQITAIDCDTNIDILRKNLPNATIIEHDLEKGLPELPEEILADAIVISSDVIEHIIEPHRYLKGLAELAKKVPYLLVSTPDRTRARGAEDFGPPNNPFHVREWTIDELNLLLLKYGISHNIGFTVSNDHELIKATILALGGTQTLPVESPAQKVLAIMTAYNEEDIIENSVKHLLAQGVDVHVIDNWSDDKTFSRVKALAKEDKRVSYERFPLKKPQTHKYEWAKLLQRASDVASASPYDWVIHNDADELRTSPWRNVSLSQAIAFVDSLGYNAIDFTVMDFRPTQDGYTHKHLLGDFFTGFELKARPGYTRQIKGWKNVGEVNLVSTGGHHVWFNEQRIFPLKFLSKHYPLRSSSQAKKKIFKDRTFTAEEKKKGWHVQYDGYQLTDTFLWNVHDLDKFSDGNFYNEYMVERLSGIGIND